MGMSEEQAEKALARMADKIAELFYGGRPFTFRDTTDRVVPKIVEVTDENYPEASLMAASPDSWGVMVSRPLLELADDGAIEFGLAHELGHAFSYSLLAEIGRTGTSGAITEVIADLGAAQVLSALGVSWDKILATVDDGVRTGIFTRARSGDHPAGADRAKYVRQLYELMTRQHKKFTDAAEEICATLPHH